MNRREAIKAGLAGALALAFPWKLSKPRPETFAEYANRTREAARWSIDYSNVTYMGKPIAHRVSLST